jgi:hypothetical protein
MPQWHSGVDPLQRAHLIKPLRLIRTRPGNGSPVASGSSGCCRSPRCSRRAPVLLGTSDGGATWTKETFTIPSDAPNYLGQEYLGIGDLSCPGPSACLALGGGAQSAPSTPIYRFEDSGSS